MSLKQNLPASKPAKAIPGETRPGLIRIDDKIDELARKALDSARQLEETAKVKPKTAGPKHPRK